MHKTQREGKKHEETFIVKDMAQNIRQGFTQKVSLKLLIAQVDPKDLKLLGVGALVVPLLQPACHERI